MEERRRIARRGRDRRISATRPIERRRQPMNRRIRLERRRVPHDYTLGALQLRGDL